MSIGNFYFLTDDYFVDFPDPQLMRNKENIDRQVHDRPCFYSFKDDKTQIIWMIPFSSRVGKFKSIYNSKITKNGKCDTIAFGQVLGHEKAFLIQNMCPVIPRYIKNEYYDSNANIPVRISGEFEKELLLKAKKVLNLHRKGNPLIFPDVLKIESILLAELNQK